MATHEEIMARYAILQNRPNLDLDSSDSEDDGTTLEVLQRKYEANGDFGGEDTESGPAAVEATNTTAVTAPGPSEEAPRSGLARKLQDMYGESSDGESSDSDSDLPSAANGSAQPTKHLFERSSFGSGQESRREPGSVSSAPAEGSSKGTWNETLQEKWAPMTLEEVRVASAEFAVARDWTQFHRPRNVMAALTSEIGELTEGIGLWREVGFGGDGLTAKEKNHVGEELTDCLVYLLRLADVMDVDLPKAVEAKLQKNAAKYPADLVYGSSKKYTEYKNAASSSK